MKRRLLSAIPAFLILSGCATIQDYDADKVEMEAIRKIEGEQAKRPDPFRNEPTPNFVPAGDEDDVSVYLQRDYDRIGPHNIRLQTWKVNVANNNDDPKCVTIGWKLMDFDFDTDYPDEFYIDAEDLIQLGKMKQTLFNFDGVGIALPPSGYIHSMRVRDPKVEKNAKGKAYSRQESCQIHDEDIEENPREF